MHIYTYDPQISVEDFFPEKIGTYPREKNSHFGLLTYKFFEIFFYQNFIFTLKTLLNISHFFKNLFQGDEILKSLKNDF